MRQNSIIYCDAESKQAKVQSAISNPLVLLKILKYLPSSELMYSRQVSSVWNIEITKILLKRRFIETLEIKVDPSTLKYKVFLYRAETMIKTAILNNFVRLVKKSLTFPCETVVIHFGNLSLKPIHNFFSAFGNNIKSLKLGLYSSTSFQLFSSNIDVDTLRVIIWQYVPNLHQLILLNDQPLTSKKNNKCVHKSKSTSLSEISKESNLLPNLKHFGYCVHSPKEFFDDIINSAVNLEEITHEVPMGKNLEAVLNLKKVHLIKTVPIYLEPIQDNLNLYEKFIDAKPRVVCITNLNIDQLGFLRKPELISKVVTILNLIFDASSQTLLILDCISPHGFLSKLKIPRLPNLKVLGLDYLVDPFKNIVPNIFPPSMNLTKTFPTLLYIILSFNDQVISLDPSRIFPENCNPILSVRGLNFDNIRGTISTKWVYYLSQMLPNLTVVKFPRFDDFLSAIKYIWSFRYLEDIEFRMQSTDDCANPFFLDVGFSGFTPNTCKLLNVFVPTVSDLGVQKFYQSDDFKILRVNPSIYDCQGLRKVTVHIDEGKRKFEMPFRTPILRKLIFPFYPRLNITFILHYN